MPLWSALGQWWRLLCGRARYKAFAVLGALVAVSLTLTVVRAELKLPARGTLEPVCLQNVYAAESGIVGSIRVKSGDWVKAGQTLAQLENPELRAAFENVRGERATTFEQLRAASIERLRSTGITAADRVRLAGEQDRLQAKLESLDEELAVVQRQLANLHIRSPIAGRVATWDVEQLLRDRPVKAGQLLLSVYDPDQEWQLELNVADRRVGHLTRALRQLDPSTQLEVSYVLAAAPSTVHTGRVELVQAVTELDAEEGHSVRLQVATDLELSQKALKPGTTVIADVHCGPCSLGYVWLHEVVEAAQRFWFRVF
jgi:multidrug efflux pump subunit AcrA (membrane-fusion protein)